MFFFFHIKVHKAELKDGRVLALKVQHRDVQAHSLIDMRTIEVTTVNTRYLEISREMENCLT